jgi:hypothetical protein
MLAAARRSTVFVPVWQLVRDAQFSPLVALKAALVFLRK